MMAEMEETRKRIRELEDVLAEEYGAYGKLEWYDVHECFPNEVITYSGSTASFVLHDGNEVAGGGGKQDGTGELDGLLAKLGAIEELAEELDKIKTSLFNRCQKVEEGK